MTPNDMQTALETLGKMKESLLENLVEELMRHKDDDPSSFGIQEIEDRFAIRLANLNTLIATLQDQLGQTETSSGRIVIDVEEIARPKLDSRLSELVEFMSPEEFIQFTIVPTVPGKFLVTLAHIQ